MHTFNSQVAKLLLPNFHCCCCFHSHTITTNTSWKSRLAGQLFSEFLQVRPDAKKWISGHCWNKTFYRLDTWLLTAFQSLRLHQGNICVLMPVISWLCHHIDWVPTDVGPYLLPVRQHGTLYRNSCVILSTPPPCLHVYWRHFFSLSTSAYNALGAVFWHWCAI